MKLLSIFAAILAVIVVEAVAIPSVHNSGNWCTIPGQGCKLKRTAVPVEDSLAKRGPDAEAAGKHASFWCWIPGQGCKKARRDAPGNHIVTVTEPSP